MTPLQYMKSLPVGAQVMMTFFESGYRDKDRESVHRITTDSKFINVPRYIVKKNTVGLQLAKELENSPVSYLAYPRAGEIVKTNKGFSIKLDDSTETADAYTLLDYEVLKN